MIKCYNPYLRTSFPHINQSSGWSAAANAVLLLPVPVNL